MGLRYEYGFCRASLVLVNAVIILGHNVELDIQNGKSVLDLLHTVLVTQLLSNSLRRGGSSVRIRASLKSVIKSGQTHSHHPQKYLKCMIFFY